MILWTRMHLSDIKACFFILMLRTVVEFPRILYAIFLYERFDRRQKLHLLVLIAIKGGGRPKRLLPHAKMLLVPMSFFLRWVDYAWKVLHFHCANVILAACFTLKGHGTHQFTVVFASGRQDLPSDARAFSLTSFEA